MTRIVRAALTETVNAYRDMPATVAELAKLRDKLADVRRANVEHHVELLRDATEQGAQIVCFGELFTAPYFALGKDAMWRELAEDAEHGETIARLREAARRAHAIVVAPIYELTPSGERFNTAVVIDETGELLGKYRKTHIPHGANEQASFHEDFYYARSDGKLGPSSANVSKSAHFPVFTTAIGRVGIAICYDRHFEGVMSALSREGAELVFSPAVTFGAKSRRMWPLEFEVDAARHNLVIGGSNRKGVEPPWNQPYFGESFFVGPNGRYANVSPHAELVMSDVDLDELSRGDPSGWNLPRDARPEIYRRS